MKRISGRRNGASGSCKDAEYRESVAGVADFEHDLAGCDVGCGGHALAGAEYDGHAAWRDTPVPCDREKKSRIALEISAKKATFGGINLKIGFRTRLNAPERLHQASHRFAPRHAVGQHPA